MNDTVMSMLMLLAIALVLGAVAAWRIGARKQAALMLVLALVTAGNVAVWVVPGADGTAPGSTQSR